jgi:hypothetical protein
MSALRSRLTWGRAFMTAALLAAGTAACGDDLTSPDLQNQLMVGGIAYHVTGLVIAESFPVQIGTTVEVTNTSASSQSITFPDGCVVLMRAYDAQDALAWDSANDVACTQALVEVDLSPGETKTYQTGLVSGYTILGDDLPDGEYRITVYLRPGGQTVEIEAGVADLAIPRN